MTVLKALESNPLLMAMQPQERENLAAQSRFAEAERGEAIWLHGATVDYFGLTVRGFIKMVRGNANGSDATMEIMGPGQIFGLMGTIDGQGCPLSAVAVTRVQYVRVAKSGFIPMYEGNHRLKDALLKRLHLRYKQKMDLMAKMSSGKVEERIGAILFILADSYGTVHDGKVQLKIPLTRQEISEMAGTTTESTIRVMSRWQKEGLISTDRHVITLEDVPALETIVAG